MAIPSMGQDTIDGFVGRTYKGPSHTMRYRLFIAKGYDPAKKYPVVLWLHGSGSVGNDRFGNLSTRHARRSRRKTFVIVTPVSTVAVGMKRGNVSVGRVTEERSKPTCSMGTLPVVSVMRALHALGSARTSHEEPAPAGG